MLFWSRYNRIIRNPDLGYFLYNSLSNVFIELDECHFKLIEQLSYSSSVTKNGIEPQFLNTLLANYILVEKDTESKILMERHYKRLQSCFDNTHLFLTICPTLRCNFSCPYCYEQSQESTTIMNKETINQLIKFIKKFSDTKHLSIAWYGGEPTLAFDVICDITKKINDIDIIFDQASLITNGYLLDKKKIDKLKSLNIKSIQTTIDGFEGTHNSRRTLKGGFPTYQKIIDNIDYLMNSSFNGSCHIRVNVDKKNAKEYPKLNEYLQNKYEGSNVFIYAGNVEATGNQKYDIKYTFCSSEWSRFALELYRGNSVSTDGKIYPLGNLHKICAANTHNSLIIGPDGELYKCWKDVGNVEMVIGNIFNEDYLVNRELVALYNIGTDPYLDSKCLECYYLPICGGGCANLRFRSKFLNEKGLEFCSLYKDHIDEYLMEYYDEVKSKDLCMDFLNINHDTIENGYRIIQSNIETDKIVK